MQKLISYLNDNNIDYQKTTYNVVYIRHEFDAEKFLKEIDSKNYDCLKFDGYYKIVVNNYYDNKNRR